MRQRFAFARGQYPRQFWLMFWGMLISTVGSSMVWPFMMIYVSEKLDQPLTTAASLMTLSSILGLISSLIAGPVIDRVGRKWAMAISLAVNAAAYFFLGRAETLPLFALLMGLNGAFNPLYRVGADAMMADLIPPEKRIDAYSLLRMSNNLGIAVGPMVGGFIASISYTIAFTFASTGLLIYSLLIAFFAKETLPSLGAHKTERLSESFGGYGKVLRDRPFVTFAGMFALVQVCAALVWVLLSVYAKHNYGVSEAQYGMIPATNAIMVVLLQVLITRFTRRHPPLKMLALGAAFYAAAVGSIALGQGLVAFLLSMVIMTIGELILVPTSSTYAANLAPADMRGRYMSVYGLTWGAAQGVGPLVGGMLTDSFGPRSPWIAGAFIGTLSVLGFSRLGKLTSSRPGDDAGAPEPEFEPPAQELPAEEG